MPAFNFRATLCAREIFSVNRAAASPYAVSLAFAMASASVANLLIVTTGPKISSFMIVELSSA
jgi:hypothetical protein